MPQWKERYRFLQGELQEVQSMLEQCEVQQQETLEEKNEVEMQLVDALLALQQVDRAGVGSQEDMDEERALRQQERSLDILLHTLETLKQRIDEADLRFLNPSHRDLSPLELLNVGFGDPRVIPFSVYLVYTHIHTCVRMPMRMCVLVHCGYCFMMAIWTLHS